MVKLKSQKVLKKGYCKAITSGVCWCHRTLIVRWVMFYLTSQRLVFSQRTPGVGLLGIPMFNTLLRGLKRRILCGLYAFGYNYVNKNNRYYGMMFIFRKYS